MHDERCIEFEAAYDRVQYSLKNPFTVCNMRFPIVLKSLTDTLLEWSGIHRIITLRDSILVQNSKHFLRWSAHFLTTLKKCTSI